MLEISSTSGASYPYAIYENSIYDNAYETSVVPRTLAHPKRRLQPNHVLYEAGCEASSLYVINSGVLKAVIPTAMGRNRIADLYGAGDVVGIASIDSAAHVETVIAVHKASLTPIDPQQAIADRKLNKYIFNAIAKQLRRSREAVDDAELPVGARVTKAILRLCQRFGQTSNVEEVELPLALTHEDFASLTGSSRVTITRILGELRQLGALTGSRGIYLAHLGKLEQATDEYVMQVL